MTNHIAPAATDITIVLDRSGSMSAVANDTIGGFNQFLKEQQIPRGDTCLLSLMQFDTEYEYVHKAVPVANVPPLSHLTFQPRGATALNDAIGKTIAETRARVSDDKTRCLFVIITDGEENSSREYTGEQIKQLIKTQGALPNWDFIFIGANQDAFMTGVMRYGMAGIGKTLTASAGAAGMSASFASASSYVSRGRVALSTAEFKSNAFTAEDREEQVKAFKTDNTGGTPTRTTP